MTAKNRYFVGAVIVTLSLLVILAIHRPGDACALSISQDDNFTDSPVVDYDAETTKEKSQARKKKDSHFNGLGTPHGRKSVTELPAGVEPLPSITHWWVGLTALPVDQSDTIVLGNIVNREAHLSDDKTGLYSEFTVRVEEVLKDTTGAVATGSLVPVNRLGGNVRFASGNVQKYSIARQGMPRKGAQYVLFLERTTGGDLMIVTGYELSGGHTVPLDGEDTEDPRSALPFAQYRGTAQSVFLQDLRQAVGAASEVHKIAPTEEDILP